MLVVVDVGNTTIAFGAFEGERLLGTERVEAGSALIGTVIPFPFLHAADDVIVGCSSPGRLDEVLHALGRPARVLGPAEVAPYATGYDRPEDLGLDRVAAVVGASALIGPGPLAVADVGTCVTVDGLGADGGFVPVAIAPGPPVVLAGLRHAAPHLPPAPILPGPVAVPAQGSSASLRAGVVLGLAGLVDRLLDETCALVGPTARRVITGGAAPTVVEHLRLQAVHLPLAQLHGLRVLAGGARSA